MWNQWFPLLIWSVKDPKYSLENISRSVSSLAFNFPTSLDVSLGGILVHDPIQILKCDEVKMQTTAKHNKVI